MGKCKLIFDKKEMEELLDSNNYWIRPLSDKELEKLDSVLDKHYKTIKIFWGTRIGENDSIKIKVEKRRRDRLELFRLYILHRIENEDPDCENSITLDSMEIERLERHFREELKEFLYANVNEDAIGYLLKNEILRLSDSVFSEARDKRRMQLKLENLKLKNKKPLQKLNPVTNQRGIH